MIPLDPNWQEKTDELNEKLRQGDSGPDARENLHTALDVGGCFDQSGVCDLANGGLYLCEGDFTNAGISFLAMVPFMDWAKAARLAKKLANAGKGIAKEIGKDIQKAVSRFGKQKLGQQVQEYKNLLKTYQEHLKKYGQCAGRTTGETNRMERQLEEYRKILGERGKNFGPLGEIKD